MASFLSGLAVGGATTLLAYIAQLWLYAERRDNSNPSFFRIHRLPLNAAIVFCFASLSAFCYGCWLAVNAFAAR
jgi:hypothetical protein